jgi:hypothetical protein
MSHIKKQFEKLKICPNSQSFVRKIESSETAATDAWIDFHITSAAVHACITM